VELKEGEFQRERSNDRVGDWCHSGVRKGQVSLEDLAIVDKNKDQTEIVSWEWICTERRAESHGTIRTKSLIYLALPLALRACCSSSIGRVRGSHVLK
jgi:hypothetical protein